ncbi:MAG: glycosyltransferase family 4 protein [Chloroflexota bacterium]|nr:glycosyltransferase family 4 protein [Chloroflexota bacterium]MDQ5864732.1 glycosyltransferase family 4 protein [Chloroflexota bacterium]
MRIAIDYTTGIYPGAGVARYTRQLMASLAGIDSRNNYKLFYAAIGLPGSTAERAQAAMLFGERPNFRAVPVPMSVRVMSRLWQRWQVPLPLELFTGRCDVVHSPDFISPPHRYGADVITVHDLSFLVTPECAEPTLASFLGKAVPEAARRADHIIAVSKQTKRDLTQLLSVPPERVTVAYNGVDARFRPMRGDPAVDILRQKLGLPERFILHVGTLEPRKNLARLIDAYGLLVGVGPSAAPNPRRTPLRDVALVLAGRRGWLYEPIYKAAERVNNEGGNVVFLDFVRDDHLPLLYNMAEVFAYPSLYEGFGLPAAEALACGVPTLVSTDGALKEVTDEAALAADPRSIEEIASNLQRLLTDEALREELAQAGPRQVARFTWEAAARTVLSVYEGLGKLSRSESGPPSGII